MEYEFDFVREANAMDRIGVALDTANKGKSPIIVPRSIPGLVTRYAPITIKQCRAFWAAYVSWEELVRSLCFWDIYGKYGMVFAPSSRSFVALRGSLVGG